MNPPTTLAARLAARRHFLLYCTIGASGATLDFVVYCALVNALGWHHQLANFVGITCGITNNFAWNAGLNFRVRDRLWRRFASFYAVGCFGLGLSALMLYVGIDRFHFDRTLAKLVTVGVIVVVQYNLNRRLSFRPRAG